MATTRLSNLPSWCKASSTLRVFTVGAVCINGGIELPESGASQSFVLCGSAEGAFEDDDDLAWLKAPLTPRERASTNLKNKIIEEW